MKHRLTLLLCTSFVLLALPAALRADIVVMKDGTRYEEAQIVSENAESVTFSYVFKKKFPDKRTESRANIAEIIKLKPEATEVLPLLKLAPSADLLTADKYESLIQDTLRPFLTKYPGTPEAKQVEDIIKILQTEKEKVAGGSLKVEGEWVSPEVAKRDAHSIEAYRVRRDMKELAAENKIREALNHWDKMTDADYGFTDTLQYVKAIPDVLAILDTYKKTLDSMIAAQPELDKKRKDSLSKMIDSDPIKARTQHAIDAEVADFKAKYDADKKAHVKWTSIYKYDAKSLQDAAKAVINESSKLRALELPKLTTQNEALVAASRFIADGNVEQAEAALTRATTVPNTRPPAKAIQELRKKVGVLKTEQTKQRLAKKTYGAGNVGALTNGTNSGTDSRVAEALAKTEKEKAEKKEAKDAKAADKDSPEKPATTGTKKASSKSEDKPKKASAAAAAPTPEEGGMQTYLVAGGGGLLAILLAVLFFQKKKPQ